MNTQNSSGMMNGLPPLRKSERKIGPIVGALIIVLILIIAALYFFGKKLNTDSEVIMPVATSTDTMSTGTSKTATSTSTSTDDTSSFDTELDAQLEDVDYSF